MTFKRFHSEKRKDCYKFTWLIFFLEDQVPSLTGDYKIHCIKHVAKKSSPFQVTVRRNKILHLSKALLASQALGCRADNPRLYLLLYNCHQQIYPFSKLPNELSFKFRLVSGIQQPANCLGSFSSHFKGTKLKKISFRGLSPPSTFRETIAKFAIENLPFIFHLHFFMLSEVANHSTTVNQNWHQTSRFGLRI